MIYYYYSFYLLKRAFCWVSLNNLFLEVHWWNYMLVNISSNINYEYHPNIIFHYRLICHISFYTDMKNHVPNDTTDTILEDHEVLYKRKISRAKRRCKKKYQQGRVFICCKGKSSVSNLWTCQISILIKTDFLKVFFQTAGPSTTHNYWRYSFNLWC